MKDWYFSKTIVSAVVLVLYNILQQAWLDVASEEVEWVVNALVNLILWLSIIFWRTKAKTKIKPVKLPLPKK